MESESLRLPENLQAVGYNQYFDPAHIPKADARAPFTDSFSMVVKATLKLIVGEGDFHDASSVPL